MTDESDIARLAAATTLCISLAERPSRFGITVHNAAFRALGLDYLYKAFRPVDLALAIAGVRGLGIRGCGVSMPYKVEAISLLDAIDPPAAVVGAINTIVNDDGILTGYNTDTFAARKILSDGGLENVDRVLLLGSGGVARAILYALSSFSLGPVHIAARNPQAADALGVIHPVVHVPWEQRGDVDADVLINATPIGMQPDIGGMPVDESCLSRVRLVCDVVADPPVTRLVSAARKQGCGVVIDGLTMSILQAGEQFRLYTGREAPLEIMRRAAKQLTRSPA